MSQSGLWTLGPRQTDWPNTLRSALRPAAPALLFGLRLWVAVCLALYIAFWLELDNAYWAGTTAALVCQPSLGASLRKGWFRMVGTTVGAVAIVVLTACFPQNRFGFLLGLALWGAACAFVATLLRNYATYAAALAGYTVAIIASDELGAVGGANGQAFTLAITRASEICIGIVCAGVVLAATDFGGARHRLATLFASVAAEIMGQCNGSLLLAGSDLPDTRPAGRELIARVVALDPIIDQAIGESSYLRYHSPVFQRAVNGLFAALAGWRGMAAHLAQLPHDQARKEAKAVLEWLPKRLRAAPLEGEPTRWIADPTRLRLACDEAVRALSDLPTHAPSSRLLADQTAEVLTGTSHALLALRLLVEDPARPVLPRRGVRLHVPDWLPAFVSAARAFLTIGAVELVWIITAWPSGAGTIAWAAIAVILLAPRADQAYATTISFMVGTGLAAGLAAIVNFAVLPGLAGFAALSAAVGLVLVPAGALTLQPWRTAMFIPMAVNFVPLLAPANQMNYDPQQFYNASLAIVAGLGAAALAFRLLPPLSPGLQTHRLLTLTLRELRRLATSPVPPTAIGWESRIYSRLSVLPEQAQPLQRAQLLAALSVGSQIIRLRRVARQLDLRLWLDAALDAVAGGNSVVATECLARVDQTLAALPSTSPRPRIRLRARASLIALSEALTRHAAYFNAGTPR
ncbi:MAG: hypothetical protein QOD93_7479 [Acetobacteraceae bacterium]|nr:hypothetical protein [Acetobacteraceae bacterium]